jgi:quercetin dioxygenase-like cupin family protein
MSLMTRCRTAATVLAVGCAATAALAQAQGIKRTVLQRQDLAGAEQKECVLASAEIEPGANVGKHFHPGLEVAYIAEGALDLMVDGEQTKHLKAGDSYRIDVRKPHDARNTGSTPTKVVVTYVVEKGQPLATPVK